MEANSSQFQWFCFFFSFFHQIVFTEWIWMLYGIFEAYWADIHSDFRLEIFVWTVCMCSTSTRTTALLRIVPNGRIRSRYFKYSSNMLGFGICWSFFSFLSFSLLGRSFIITLNADVARYSWKSRFIYHYLAFCCTNTQNHFTRYASRATDERLTLSILQLNSKQMIVCGLFTNDIGPFYCFHYISFCFALLCFSFILGYLCGGGW